MTIAMGFKFDDGVLLCADTKITSIMKSTRTKLTPWTFFVGNENVGQLVFAAAGNVEFARRAAEQCARSVGALDWRSATIEDVQDALESALTRFHEQHIFQRPDRDQGNHEIYFIFGLLLRQEIYLLASSETVVNVVSEYDCKGTGAYLAEYFIRQYWKAQEIERLSYPPTIDDVGVIAAYALECAMEYDEYCGGESEFIVLRKNGKIACSINATLYPAGFPFQIQTEMWRLIRKLATACDKAEAEMYISDFWYEVSKLHEPHIAFRDAVLKPLKEKTQQAENTPAQDEP